MYTLQALVIAFIALTNPLFIPSWQFPSPSRSPTCSRHLLKCRYVSQADYAALILGIPRLGLVERTILAREKQENGNPAVEMT